MAKYRTVMPLSYVHKGKVIHVAKAGVIIDLDQAQAAALGNRVLYVGIEPAAKAVSTVLLYDSAAELPLVGDVDHMYLTGDTDRLYRWRDVDNAYVEIGTNRVSVPSASTGAGRPGQWAANATHAYFCIATNTWVRAAVASW